MLEVQGLTACHGATLAVRDVSLHVAATELVALVGPNGAGKSTLARAIAGTHRPVAGSVRFAGTDITRLDAAAIAARGLTHVPEGRPLALTLSVRDNLLAGAHVLGSLRLARQRLETVLPWFPGLRDRLAQPAAALSGGERQWLVVARALMAQPRALLIDEPTLGLGPHAAQATLDVIAGLRASGTAVLLIEQNAALALGIADRGLVMAQGRIVADGPALSLRGAVGLGVAYLGNPSREERR
ncbi:ABC transporter ATP-binding protein [Vineibacter terrae]|uniref:ABC transporter ATP-binding protein n=1 Tax=Vineibacter terrae TaxID=2586908 RepID=A0A5C8PI83_9HYPH|nr:ABC transporter ATP-binding protein [Vineibacter terrae]TXL73211.1 ABC transporter ATP-binding protein [Vineibacter terrae]